MPEAVSLNKAAIATCRFIHKYGTICPKLDIDDHPVSKFCGRVIPEKSKLTIAYRYCVDIACDYKSQKKCPSTHDL